MMSCFIAYATSFIANHLIIKLFFPLLTDFEGSTNYETLIHIKIMIDYSYTISSCSIHFV